MVTKRQLGIGFILMGTAGMVGLFAWDFLGRAEFRGIGPTQLVAMAGMGLLILVGITLLPLGNRPA
jgi:hypothetical protein